MGITTLRRRLKGLVNISSTAFQKVRAARLAAFGRATDECLRYKVKGTEFTWFCKRCDKRWIDRRSTNWRPFECRLNGYQDVPD